MPNTSVTTRMAVGSNGRLSNTILQVSQNPSTLTSQVNVQGEVTNLGSASVSGNGFDANISGFELFQQGPWSYSLAKNQSKVFVNHTFTCLHDDRGNLTVDFTVGYGFSGSDVFGNNESLEAELTLLRIPTVPTPPVNLRATNFTPTSISLAWDAPADDGGNAITGYQVLRYNGASAAGNPLTYPWSPGLGRNFTDLVPGQEYTYQVFAVNKVPYHGGHSDVSDPLTVQTNTGVSIRHGGHWVKALPYVRSGGLWLPAAAFIRTTNGIWKGTNN